MSQTVPGMSFNEKTTLVLSVIGAVIAFCVLVLGDNLLRLTYKPDIYVSTNTVALEGLGSSKEHVRLFDFINSGSAPSTNLKVVARFQEGDIKFKLRSDEEVTSSSIKDTSVEVSLGRFSPRSHLTLSVVSQSANPLLEAYYIDDNGKTRIDPDRQISNEQMLLRLVAILAVVIAVFFVIRVFARRLEMRIVTKYETASLALHDKLNELKADLSDLKFQSEESESLRRNERRVGTDSTAADQEVWQRLQALLRPTQDPGVR